ncbi:MAG: hypothetical protein M3X11_01660 [Acidobacteriota bacterium]|nr:hypothetical protein [Acidobacteriota bacterium]
MPINRDEEWVQIAYLDSEDHIRFTEEYIALMGDQGWEAKAFISHLIGLWYDPFEHLLDHGSGEATITKDQPGIFDRNALDEPQDVVEYWALDWSRNGKNHSPSQEAGTGLGLSADWYRDVLRAKVVSLQLPKRLLLEYKSKLSDRRSRFELLLQETQQRQVK